MHVGEEGEFLSLCAGGNPPVEDSLVPGDVEELSGSEGALLHVFGMITVGPGRLFGEISRRN